MIDIDDIENRLSNSYSIMNIDIAKCYKLVYNKNNLEGISDLEKLSAIIGCEYLEDVASILERGKISMDKKEKEKLLKEIKAKIKDKDILEAIKLENSIDDRFKMIEAMSLEKGREENTVEIIKAMLDNNSSYEYISKITGKSKKEIDSIAKNM